MMWRIVLFVIFILVSYYFPWWMLSISGIIMGWIWNQKAMRLPFLEGFLWGGLAWLMLALLMNAQNDFVLINRLTVTFMMPHVSVLFIVHFLVGGLLGGSAMWVGFLSRANFKNTSRKC